MAKSTHIGRNREKLRSHLGCAVISDISNSAPHRSAMTVRSSTVEYHVPTSRRFMFLEEGNDSFLDLLHAFWPLEARRRRDVCLITGNRNPRDLSPNARQNIASCNPGCQSSKIDPLLHAFTVLQIVPFTGGGARYRSLLLCHWITRTLQSCFQIKFGSGTRIGLPIIP